MSIYCGNCEETTKHGYIEDPDCKCTNKGFVEHADLPCWHQWQLKCENCGFYSNANDKLKEVLK